MVIILLIYKILDLMNETNRKLRKVNIYLKYKENNLRINHILQISEYFKKIILIC